MEDAIRKVRPALFRVLAQHKVADGQFMHVAGTGFAVALGVVITAAHLLHQNKDLQQPIMEKIFLSPGEKPSDISLCQATFLAEDSARDLAVVRVDVAATPTVASLLRSSVGVGVPCGSLGFPLLGVDAKGHLENAHMRFQASVIAAHMTVADGEAPFEMYETDHLMLPGSSGCPAFIESGEVFGVHIQSLGLTQDHYLQLTEAVRPLRELIKDIPATRIPIARWVASTEVLSLLKRHVVAT